MSRKDEKEYPCELILKRIHEEIIPLFGQAIYDNEVYFHNPYIPHCWENKKCEKKDCPTYGKAASRCWQISGTFCGGLVQGAFVEKYENCTTCDVFKESCPTLVEELGESLNNLLYLLRKEKNVAREQMKKIEYLNKELLSSLENLDSRNREIQELVITDKLTGLYNRHYLTSVLDDEIHRCERQKNTLALMMIDIDNFKSVNDTYGHMFGDELLSCLGSMLKDNLRKCDRSFRYGGEEFVILLPDTDLTIAWIAAERIRNIFENKHFTYRTKEDAKQTVSRTLSFGLARYEQGLSGGDLISRADEAMYKAKTEGKNRVIRYGID